MKVPVHSVSVTKERSHVLVGLEDGKLIVVGAGQPSEVRKRAAWPAGQEGGGLWGAAARAHRISSHPYSR